MEELREVLAILKDGWGMSKVRSGYEGSFKLRSSSSMRWEKIS